MPFRPRISPGRSSWRLLLAAGIFSTTAGLLAQSASFDERTGLLTISAVSVGTDTYVGVTLQHLGNLVFRLLGAMLQPGATATSTYDAPTGVLAVPNVRVGARGYNARFQNIGDLAFRLLSATPHSRISTSSYANFKQIGLTPQVLPRAAESATAHAWGDFFGDGGQAVFAAQLTYSVNRPPAEATPAIYTLWRRTPGGGFTLEPSQLTGSPSCLHPRTAIVADFNVDDRPDVFIACHGYDRSPFPGEHNDIVLSQPDGRYRVQQAGPQVGFFHGASSADVNGDGLPDVVVTGSFDNRSLVFLINQGDGTFRSDFGRLPRSFEGKNYYTVTLVDVNGDGLPDLLLGGHEWQNQSVTRLLLNPGNYDFSSAPFIDLPPVPGDGVVLDFVVTFTGATPVVWILRTSGGDGTFYEGVTVQRVTGPPLSSSVVFRRRPGRWIPWIIPALVSGQAVIVSDDAAAGLLIPQ